MMACFASCGHRVIGVDANPERVASLRAGQAPLHEPGLSKLLAQNHFRIEITSDLAMAGNAEILFVIVPTPSDAHGSFSPEHVLSAIENIGALIRSTDEYRLVVVSSTLMPEAMNEEVLPALERASGRRCGETLGLCYNPEFIALGRVLEDLTNPDFVLIGESDDRAGATLHDFYRTILDAEKPVRRMTFVNAELTKLAVNGFVTMKISFANLLAEMCERLPGGDVHAVTAALGDDRRIGGRYLTGATAFGGPCFPRDNRALDRVARALGVEASLPQATDAINRRQTARMMALLCRELRGGCRVAVLGLAYRLDTDVLEASAGVDLTESLLEKGFEVVIYEPSGPEATQRRFAARVVAAGTLEEAIRGAEAIVVCLPHPEFLRLNTLIPRMAGASPLVVVDSWGLLDGDDLSKVSRYERLGRAATRFRTSDVDIGEAGAVAAKPG